MTLDEALALLPEGADWRRLTPTSMSVYAASPYNASAQVRYDGYGATHDENRHRPQISQRRTEALIH
jgi:hypothetical protein